MKLLLLKRPCYVMVTLTVSIITSIESRGTALNATARRGPSARLACSLKVFGVYASLWTGLAGTAFWAEPLLLWRAYHGQSGLGHITSQVWALGTLGWVVPMLLLEVYALFDDANSAACRGHALEPVQYLVAYVPWAPVSKHRITTNKQSSSVFRSQVAWATALIATIVFALTFMGTLAGRNDGLPWLTPSHVGLALRAATLFSWVAVSVMITTVLALLQKPWHGSLLRALPWHQPWTMPYAVLVAPMAPVFAMSGLRLLARRMARTYR